MPDSAPGTLGALSGIASRCERSGIGTMTADAAPGTRRGRRNDPDRRDRIIDACLDVIAEAGVVGTSHRKVAEAAGVPLGSMTYYFTGIDELLHEAFSRFSATVAERFEHRMVAATGAASAVDAVVAIILEDVFGSSRDLVLTHELYTLAARRPEYRAITSAWMARSRAALERWFDPESARQLDALIEGLTIHRALDAESRDPGEVARAVQRLAPPDHARDSRPHELSPRIGGCAGPGPDAMMGGASPPSPVEGEPPWRPTSSSGG